MNAFFRQVITDEAGVTAIEYALIAALIAIAITVGANLLGQNLAALFNAIVPCIQAPNIPCAP